MTAVALRGLAGRKLRAALTALAIVLGVAMISGTYVLTDTIDKAFSNIFTTIYEDTDAVITGKSAFGDENDFVVPPPFPESFAAKPTPFGVSFTGLACSEPRILALAYAFEQATRKRVPPEL